MKIIKNDLDFYKDKYEEISKEINHLTNLAIDFLENISYPIVNLKNIIINAINKYKNIIKNLSIPLIYKEKNFKKFKSIKCK